MGSIYYPYSFHGRRVLVYSMTFRAGGWTRRHATRPVIIRKKWNEFESIHTAQKTRRTLSLSRSYSPPDDIVQCNYSIRTPGRPSQLVMDLETLPRNKKEKHQKMFRLSTFGIRHCDVNRMLIASVQSASICQAAQIRIYSKNRAKIKKKRNSAGLINISELSGWWRAGYYRPG